MDPCRHRARRDCGEVVTQVVLVVPALLLSVLLVVQLALWMHAAHVGDAAASRGAAAAAASGGTATDGRAAITAFVAESGSRLAANPAVTRSATTVQAEVRVRLPRLVPGVPRAVVRRVTVPVERFVPEPRR
jgi:Flp pilus assembly protein TadG